MPLRLMLLKFKTKQFFSRANLNSHTNKIAVTVMHVNVCICAHYNLYSAILWLHTSDTLTNTMRQKETERTV